MHLTSQKSNEFKELLDLIPGYACVLDENGKILYADKSWQNFYRPGVVANFSGLVVGTDYLDECSRWGILSEAQVKGVRSVLKRDTLIYETVYSCYYLGEVKWFLLKAVCPRGDEGCLVLKFDVTEKKNAENKSSLNEAILKSLIDNSPAIIYMKDMSGKFIHVNKMFEQVVGVKRKEIIGQKPYEVLPWDVADRFVKNDRKVLGDLKPLFIEEQFSVGGQVNTFYSIQFPLRGSGGEPIGVACISSDMTDRKKSEEELHRYKNKLEESLSINKERFELFLESITDGVWDWDLSTDEVFYSPRWLESLGYKPGELEPHIDSWKKLIHPDDMPKVMQALYDHLEGKSDSYQCENRLLQKDGNWRWNIDRGRVVRKDQHGKPLRVVGSDTDITRLKSAEFALRSSKQDLKKSHQQLRDLSNKLQTVREEEKKRISREIHDELGQTLTAIKLDLTWLEKRIDVAEPPMRDKIESIYMHLQNSLDTVRRVSTELRPQVLDVMGFCEALQWQAEKFSANTNIRSPLKMMM